MTIKCEVIRDLIPLYVEKLASEESVDIVEHHLNNCDNCKTMVNEMLGQESSQICDDIKALKKLRFTLKFDKYKSVTFAILISLIMSVLVMNIITAPEYLEYSEEIVDIRETANGSVYAVLDGLVAGYDINSSTTKEEGVQELSLTTWTTILHKLTAPKKEDNLLLNTEGIPIESVYYYNAVQGGTNDRLIYGDPGQEDFRITLPRLVLGMYLAVAMVSFIFLTMFWLLTFKLKKARGVLSYLILFPLGYIISHFMIMGLKSSTYSPARDFYAILLLSLPMILLLVNVMKIHREKLK